MREEIRMPVAFALRWEFFFVCRHEL